MLKLISGGRMPKRAAQPAPTVTREPISSNRARQLILSHRAWDGMRVTGHLNLRGADQLYELPPNLSCDSLDISNCLNLTSLPPGLRVRYWIELAGSGITSLPAGHGFVLRWEGVRVSDRIAFGSESLTGQEILNLDNVELRRIAIERLGYERFIEQVGGLIRDRDRDAGGDRQLVYIPFEDDEPLMVLKVICPSTAHTHVLRVPPAMETCHQAAAWIAGFDNPDEYQPLIEA